MGISCPVLCLFLLSEISVQENYQPQESLSPALVGVYGTGRGSGTHKMENVTQSHSAHLVLRWGEPSGKHEMWPTPSLGPSQRYIHKPLFWVLSSSPVWPYQPLIEPWATTQICVNSFQDMSFRLSAADFPSIWHLCLDFYGLYFFLSYVHECLPVCMFVHHMCAYCPLRPEDLVPWDWSCR